MIDSLLQLIAPHLCTGCSQVGTLLCDNCKYDIISEPYERCIICQVPSPLGVCRKHRHNFQKAWCVGERRGPLQYLIGGYKFQNKRAAFHPLAQLLDERLPILPENTVIIPVPTLRSHIRERSYDHVGLIARQLSRLRQLPVQKIIEHTGKTTQRHSNRDQRIAQALKAFQIKRAVEPEKIYLIVDDVVTTGATIQHVAKLLKQAGAVHIWAAVIARQPLD